MIGHNGDGLCCQPACAKGHFGEDRPVLGKMDCVFDMECKCHSDTKQPMEVCMQNHVKSFENNWSNGLKLQPCKKANDFIFEGTDAFCRDQNYENCVSACKSAVSNE